jgi:quercetin dioxygenase-like cupin family protein
VRGWVEGPWSGLSPWPIVGDVEPMTMRAIVHTAEEIGRLPAVPLGSLEGVVHRVLWQDDKSMAGVLTVEGGRSLGRHTHRANTHHIWVLEGTAEILGRTLGPGGYAHIPSGVEHDIDATGSAGCTVYYLYLAPAFGPVPARPRGVE